MEHWRAFLWLVALPNGICDRQVWGDANLAWAVVDGWRSRVRGQHLHHHARPRRSGSGQWIAHRVGDNRRVLDYWIPPHLRRADPRSNFPDGRGVIRTRRRTMQTAFP